MPKVFRVMAAAGGKPQIGRSAVALGVRVGTDISPDADGLVIPGQGGMSVSPSPRALPAHRVPKRLHHLVPAARGKDHHYVWRMGEGPFVPTPLATGLRLRPDPGNASHGMVQPSERMGLVEDESALAATQDEWSIEEQ